MTNAKIYNKRLPTMALDTNRIIQSFLDAEVGEVITYDELSDLVGYDIQKKRGALSQAQTRLLNHHGIVFSCMRNVGMKRITAEENVHSTDAYLTSIRNKSYKKMKELGCVDNFDELSTKNQHKHNTAMSVFGLLNSVSQRRAFKKIESKIVKAGDVLPPLKTMELFLSDNPVKKEKD
jgi:hypothetical protein